MCLDKGYDFPEVYELLEDYGYIIHITEREENVITNWYQDIEEQDDDG